MGAGVEAGDRPLSGLEQPHDLAQPPAEGPGCGLDRGHGRKAGVAADTDAKGLADDPGRSGDIHGARGLRGAAHRRGEFLAHGTSSVPGSKGGGRQGQP